MSEVYKSQYAVDHGIAYCNECVLPAHGDARQQYGDCKLHFSSSFRSLDCLVKVKTAPYETAHVFL